MIFQTVDFLSKEVNKYLNLTLGNLPEDRLKYGNVSRALDDAVNDPVINDKAILSLVNVEEDRISRQQENYSKSDTKTIYKNPPVYLNLYLLFSVNKPDYKKSLEILGSIIQFFQYQHVFTPLSHPALNANIQSLVVDLYTLNFEQVNHLWSTLGGKYLPSVLYKVRQITIDENAITSESGFIKEIHVNEKMQLPLS
ncbi:MAG: DUF4255 domain-containing protein [Bacteroidota bacterium]